MAPAHQRLFAFDMDGTLIPGTTAAQEISRAAGCLDQIRTLEQRYGRQEIDSLEFSRRALELWASAGDDLFARAWRAAPKLSGITEVLAAIRSEGHISCLLTMAPGAFAAEFTGFDHVHGSEHGRTILSSASRSSSSTATWSSRTRRLASSRPGSGPTWTA